MKQSLDEHRKLAKLTSDQYENNMFYVLDDLVLFGRDSEKWTKKNKSYFKIRDSEFGIDSMKDLFIYPDESKYTSLNDVDLLNTRLDYDGYKKYVNRLKDSEAKKPLRKDAVYVTREKKRIEEQKLIKDYTREDHFAIGTVYLSVPPTQISISDEKHNFRYNSLRSKGETILSSGRSTTRVDLDIFFNGLEDINNKLRPILAQFKTTPFLPIENTYIKAILNPFGNQIMPEDQISLKTKQLDELERGEALVRQLIEVSSQRKDRDGKIREKLNDIAEKGFLDYATYTKLVDWVKDTTKIPKEETYPEDWTDDGQFDLKHWLNRQITTGGDWDNKGMQTLERNINDIALLREEILALQRKSVQLSADAMVERFSDKQIVGVLSQISISTVPDFPETLACRMSLYIFNYEPFSEDFAFIAGKERNKWTTDITKCDLFIEWYTKRFLSGDGTLERPGLSEVTGNDDMTIAFLTHYEPVDKKTINRETIQPDKIEIKNGIDVTGITISFRNIIKFLPILSHKNPTCQYMGSYNSDIQINMEATSLSKVNELSRMVERIGIISRTDNRLSRNNFVAIRNELIRFCGMRFFVINSYNVDTVPDNPGLYSISLALSEYRINTEKIQKLRRKGVVTHKDIERTAKWTLEEANRFAANGGKYDTNNPYRQSEKYYSIWANNRDGWLSTNMFYNFYRGIGDFGGLSGQDTEFNELKEKLRMRSKTPIPDKLKSDPKNILVWEESAKTIRRQYRKLDDVNKYSKRFFDAFNGEGENPTEFFDSQVDLASKIAAKSHRDELIQLIYEADQNSELHKFLEESRNSDDNESIKDYCYPDLELPKYIDIVDGSKHKITYAENGDIPPEGAGPDDTMQDDMSEVDPDFFFYKGSIWGMMNDKDSELNKSLDMGTQKFRQLVNNHKQFKWKEALSEDVLGDKLDDITKENTEAKEKPNLSKEDEAQIARSNLEGRWVTVKKVFDGDTISITDNNGKFWTVRLKAINAPGDPSNKSKGFKKKEKDDKKFGPKATAALSKLVPPGSKVYLTFDSTMTGKYGRLLANIYTKEGEKEINVNIKMIEQMKSLGIRAFNDPENSLQMTYDQAFSRANEIYVKALIPIKKDGPIAKWLNIDKKWLESGIDASAGSFGGGFAFVALPLFREVARLAAVTVGKKKDVRDYIGIAAAGFANLTAKFIAGSTNNEDLGKNIRESASEMISNIINEKNEHKYGYNRFDRMSDDHIDLITKRIKETQKDDVLRVTRAFPTFKLYFIEEDMEEWGMLDDLYSYNAVQSIDIVRSRKEPADTAVIKLLNTKGTLDTSKFGIYSKDGRYQKRGEKESIKIEHQETKDEQSLDEFILKAGTRIQIKMGYSSDPELLDLVFNGMVAEVEYGDVITIVAQGYGVELLQNIKEVSVPIKAAAGFKYLDKLIKRPDVLHFGKWKLAPMYNGNQKVLGRRRIFNQDTGEWEEPGKVRNIKGIPYILSRINNTADDNIWTPTQTWWYNTLHGGDQDFMVYNKTIWDVFQEMSRRMPGYIATVIPFDDRATIYFGPADCQYWYTNRNFTKRKEFESILNDETEEEKLKASKINFGYEYKEATADEIEFMLGILSNYFSKKYSSAGALERLDIKVVIDSFNNPDLNRISENHIAKKILNTQMESDLRGTKEDNVIRNGINLMKNILKDPKDYGISAKIGTNEIVFSYKPGSDKLLKRTDNNNILTRLQGVERYNRTRKRFMLEEHPNKKLVRQYHYKDSVHHIIANNIIASNQYMYNKSVVRFGLQKYWRKEEQMKKTGAPLGEISCQADDDIWPEKIKEKIVQEPNALDKVTAWLYGLSHLWLGMRDMYTGHLTMLGDPSIKPYDFIFLNDYYTNMHGPVEVEQVVHHFSPETGFITTIVPDLVCYVNNMMQMGTNLLAGAYADEYSSFIMKTRAFPLTWFFRNPITNILFKIGGLTDNYREPISFTPLLYADRPYLAGIEGFKKNSLGAAVAGRVMSMWNLYTKETPEHIDAFINRFFSVFFNRGKL